MSASTVTKVIRSINYNPTHAVSIDPLETASFPYYLAGIRFCGTVFNLAATRERYVLFIMILREGETSTGVASTVVASGVSVSNATPESEVLIFLPGMASGGTTHLFAPHFDKSYYIPRKMNLGDTLHLLHQVSDPTTIQVRAALHYWIYV